jgi:GNAT superfamily N-acetyltransferase
VVHAANSEACLRIYTQAMAAGKIPEIRVREASEADIPVLVPLVNRAFDVEDKYITGVERTDPTEMLSLMNEGSFLVSEDELGPVGCVHVKINGPTGYFGMLAVDPQRQKCGLGAKLIAAAEEFVRERGCSVMEMTVINLQAHLFPYYHKLGYVEIGHEGRREGKREPLVAYHLIRMRKSL